MTESYPVTGSGDVKPGPFARSWRHYYERGWVVLPVDIDGDPRGGTVPVGYTGRYGGTRPTSDQLLAWESTYGGRNVGVVMPDTVIGIDVDCYDGKIGCQTLEQFELAYGQLPPTWMITSRTDGSGIRLFRVPASRKWPHELGKHSGVEILQRTHRWARTCPSRSLKTGDTYRVYGPDNAVVDEPPYPDQLPELPETWIRALLGQEKAHRQRTTSGEFAPVYDDDGNEVDPDDLLLHGAPPGDQNNRLFSYVCSLRARNARRIEMIRLAGEVVSKFTNRDPSNEWTEQQVIDLVDRVIDTYGPGEAPASPEAVAWAKATVEAHARKTSSEAPGGPDVPTYVEPAETAGEDILRDVRATKSGEAYQRALYDLVRRREMARDAAAIERGTVEIPELRGLKDLLNEPDEATRYRITGFWPFAGRCICAAARKTGKTTLVGNVVKALVDGEPFLGCCPVEDVPGVVVVIDNEMSPGMLRRWYRDLGIRNADRVVLLPLRGRGASFDILDEAVRADWARRLAGLHTATLVLDCLTPALGALGLTESNEDVNRFLVAFDALLLEAGITDALVMHHMGHVEERSRGASRLRDWPDAEWRYVRERTEEGKEIDNGARFLTAYGRDVDTPETRVLYDTATRTLALGDGSRFQHKATKHLPVVAEIVAERPGITTGDLKGELKERTSVANATTLHAIVQKAIKEGLIEVRPGPNRTKVHFPAGSYQADQVIPASYQESGGT